MEIKIDQSLKCPGGIHGPSTSLIERSKLKLFAYLLTTLKENVVKSNKSLPHHIKSDVKYIRSSANEVIMQHKKIKFLNRIRRYFHFEKLSKNTAPDYKKSGTSRVEPANSQLKDTIVKAPNYCCELERRAEVLVDRYKELFRYRPENEMELLEQRNQILAALTPCTFMSSSDQCEKMIAILENVIKHAAPTEINEYNEFVHVGDLFISAHRFLKVQLSSQSGIYSDAKSNVSLPAQPILVDMLSPTTMELGLCDINAFRKSICLSSIWFVYIDYNLLADSNFEYTCLSEYDTYAEQLLSDLFVKGHFGEFGDEHNLIIPLIFNFESVTLNISRIPQNLRPFCAILTENGLHLGKVAFNLIRIVFSYLLTELFNHSSLNSPVSEAINYLPNKISNEIEKMQVSVFLYYMELRLLSVLAQTKFAKFEAINSKDKMNNTELFMKFLNSIEFGSGLILENSNLLLQCILQNRYQFRLREYWISSTGQETASNDKIKIMTNVLDKTFGIIHEIIIYFTKAGFKILTDKLSQALLKLCSSFLKIFFQSCDFSVNEEITVIRFDSDREQYVKNVERVTLNSLRDVLIKNPCQTKQLPISFVDFFQLIHYVLENLTIRSLLIEWMPILHCEIQLILNKLIWLEDSQNLTHPDFYFTFPIPLGKNLSALSWRPVLRALNVITTCCERMNLPKTDLLYISVCEIIYQIFLPHLNFTITSANKSLDPKWRLNKFRSNRSSLKQLLFRSEFKSIDWEGVQNVFQALFMQFWINPPDIPIVQELISDLAYLFEKGSANLTDNDAGILRYKGIITPHTAIRERGSIISFVNDARFDSLHFLMPRILYPPDQLIENFEALQIKTWNENPFRFLIQYLLENSEPEITMEARELEPPWQYSTATFSLQRQVLHDGSLVHSSEDLQGFRVSHNAAESKQADYDEEQQDSDEQVPVQTVSVRSKRQRSESQNSALTNGLEVLDLQTYSKLTNIATLSNNSSRPHSRKEKESRSLEFHRYKESPQTLPRIMLEGGVSSPLVDRQEVLFEELEMSSQTHSQHTEMSNTQSHHTERSNTTATGSSSNATSHLTTAAQQVSEEHSSADSQDPLLRFVHLLVANPEDDTASLDYYARHLVVTDPRSRRHVTLPTNDVYRGLLPMREPSPCPDTEKAIDVGNIQAT